MVTKGERWGGGINGELGLTYTHYYIEYIVDNQQGLTVQHRELCSIFCNNLNGKIYIILMEKSYSLWNPNSVPCTQKVMAKNVFSLLNHLNNVVMSIICFKINATQFRPVAPVKQLLLASLKHCDLESVIISKEEIVGRTCCISLFVVHWFHC